MGSILDLAKADARNIVNSWGFNQTLTITPTGEDPIVIQGLATRHSQGFDDDGLPIISDNVHCSFSELDVNEAGITTRNSEGNLIIKGWKVSFTDAIGNADYKMAAPQPDNTLGIIIVTLSHYNG